MNALHNKGPAGLAGPLLFCFQTGFIERWVMLPVRQVLPNQASQYRGARVPRPESLEQNPPVRWPHRRD